MVRSLQALGAHVIQLPTIEIRPRSDLAELDQALSNLDAYDWLIFTSVNGVAITWERWLASGHQAWPEDLRLGAIGPATAGALADRDRPPVYSPDKFVAEALAEGLPQVSGRRILLPRAGGARPVLPERLRARGAKVDEIEIYDSLPASGNRQAIEVVRTGVDVFTFTSPSTVMGAIEVSNQAGLDLVALASDLIIACIGPITAAAAEEAGLRPAVVAEQHDIPGLIEALVKHVKQE
jgi:uroporphyrinogen III methyltransferase/synthase